MVQTSKKVSRKSQQSKKKQKWNSMSHLVLKRFPDTDPTLTAGARRDRVKHPHVAIVEKDPSGRSACKLCGHKIPKGDIRFGLMLECHKGYRILCTLHQDCAWKHKETKKLTLSDLFFKSDIDSAQRELVRAAFQEHFP